MTHLFITLSMTVGLQNVEKLWCADHKLEGGKVLFGCFNAWLRGNQQNVMARGKKHT